jgi:hypothetical protein
MNINIDIPDELHKKLKIAAVEKNLFLRDYIIAILTDEVEH